MATEAIAVSPSFGAMLKRYRRAAGLTQEALAERAGYSVGHISKLESSARQPVPATVELLADALELSPSEQSALGRAARHNGVAAPEPSLVRAHALPPLIGRSEEEYCIRRHLEAGAESPLLLFAGEPGIGKSHLLQTTAGLGADEGWCVMEGTCRRRGAQGPFGPLLDALGGVLTHMDHAQLRAALDGCSWLVRLIPELAEMRAVPVPAWSLPSDQERRLMFAAVERFIRNIAGPAGTLLVLDNLQWAGADALDLLYALVETAPQSLLRVAGAYRDNEVRPREPLGMLIGDLAREGLVTWKTVEPLAPRAAAELLDALLAGTEHVHAETRAEVLRRAAGVPFVLVSYAQWLRSKASESGNNVAELGIPWDVSQAVTQRVAALPEVAQAVVHIAAVSDGDDPRELLTGVAGQLGYSELDVAQAIDIACEAGLLMERSEDTYAFAYDIIAEVVERSLGTAQRAYLHHEIATALAAARAPSRSEAVADHFVRAGEPESALLYLEQAGAKADALHAYADAERYYRSLADRFDTAGQLREAARAHERLGIMLSNMGRYDEALEELEHALVGYRSGVWRDEQARVIAEIGQAYYALGSVELGIARLEQEVAAVDVFPNRNVVILYTALAQLYRATGLNEQALGCAERAAELARIANDLHLLALAEMERGTALGMLDRLDEGLRVLEDAAVPLMQASGDLWTQVQALDQAAQSHILRGEFNEARTDIRRGMVIGWQLEDQLTTGVMTLNSGILSFHTGAWRRAEADLRWARATLQLRRAPARAALAEAWLGQLSLAKGRWERAEMEFKRSLDLAEQDGNSQAALTVHCALAERDLVDDKPEEAGLRLEPLLASAAYRTSELTPVLALLGWAYLDLGERRLGETLAAASVMRASATGLRCMLAEAQRIQALVAAHEGRSQDANRDVTEAVSLARTLACPYAEAKALYVSGQLLMARGEAAAAYEQLVAARSILGGLGEQLYARRVDQLSKSAAPAANSHE